MAEAGEGQVVDSRTGEPGTRMEKPPFPGKLGKEIFESVSQESWDEWTTLEVKLINEYRLNLADRDQRQVLYDHMREFFNLPKKD